METFVLECPICIRILATNGCKHFTTNLLRMWQNVVVSSFGDVSLMFTQLYGKNRRMINLFRFYGENRLKCLIFPCSEAVVWYAIWYGMPKHWNVCRDMVYELFELVGELKNGNTLNLVKKFFFERAFLAENEVIHLKISLYKSGQHCRIQCAHKMFASMCTQDILKKTQRGME